MTLGIGIKVGSVDGEEKRPFWAKCWECGHIWAAAYLPMTMALAGKVLGACHCPMCGEKKRVGIAKQDNGVLKEGADEQSQQGRSQP